MTLQKLSLSLQVLAGISSGLGVNEAKDSVTEHQPKEVYRNHACSVRNDFSFSSEYRRTRNKLFCVIITSGRGGGSLGELCGWGSRRVARVGLAVGEILLSCMGEWLGLLHS